MGAFYGGIFARDISQDEMVSAAQSVEHHCGMYIGPTIHGWTAAYPCENGQDIRISQKLAEKLKGHVIHVLVHDDDIFLCLHYQDGKLIDTFNSNPDYFGPASEEERAEQHGDAATFAGLLSEQDIATLEALLDRARSGEFAFASDALEGFANILHLPNALTSYEYLEDEETEDIEDWESFVRID